MKKPKVVSLVAETEENKDRLLRWRRALESFTGEGWDVRKNEDMWTLWTSKPDSLEFEPILSMPFGAMLLCVSTLTLTSAQGFMRALTEHGAHPLAAAEEVANRFNRIFGGVDYDA